MVEATTVRDALAQEGSGLEHNTKQQKTIQSDIKLNYLDIFGNMLDMLRHVLNLETC